MLAADRVIEIAEICGEIADRIVPLDLDGEALRVVVHLKDSTQLRVTEQWKDNFLSRYSYYWLTSENELKIGWDNAPHHSRLKNFPHHKHVGSKGGLQPTDETNLMDVVRHIRSMQ